MSTPRPERDGSKRITTTVERPDLVDIAASWIWSAFWKKNGYSLEQIRALVLTSDATVGPSQCMVLLVDGVPVGTAGLIHNDLSSRPDLTPWLAAMYVRPESRGRGYALELIRAVEAAASVAGYRRIWVAIGRPFRPGWRLGGADAPRPLRPRSGGRIRRPDRSRSGFFLSAFGARSCPGTRSRAGEPHHAD